MDTGTLLLDDVDDSSVAEFCSDDALYPASALLAVEEGTTELPVPDSLEVSA